MAHLNSAGRLRRLRDPPYCLDSGNIGDPQQQHLDSVGDAYLGGGLVPMVVVTSYGPRGVVDTSPARFCLK